MTSVRCGGRRLCLSASHMTRGHGAAPSAAPPSPAWLQRVKQNIQTSCESYQEEGAGPSEDNELVPEQREHRRYYVRHKVVQRSVAWAVPCRVAGRFAAGTDPKASVAVWY